MIQSDVSLFPFLSKLVGCTCPSCLIRKCVDYQLQQLGPPFVAPLIHRAQHQEGHLAEEDLSMVTN